MSNKRMNRGRWAMGVVVASMLAPVVPMMSTEVAATQAGPGGANVGFGFSWDSARNPAGHTASFLELDGVRANNCSGQTPLASAGSCNFSHEYDIDGAVRVRVANAANWIRWSNATSYSGGKPVGLTGCNSGSSQTSQGGRAPLTLFDCFNDGSFGQIFRPDVTGALTQFRMPMTCLQPSGTARYELYALLYEMSNDGATIAGSAPLATTLVNLTNCPTSSTWNGKTFSSSSFRMIPMSLGNPQVTAGRYYGLYLTGPGVPGTVPPGASAAMAAAKAASTTTTTTTTTTPWSSFRDQANTAPEATGPVFTALGSTRPALSALRMMSANQNKTYYINSLTPTTCLGSDRFLVFIEAGRCRVQMIVRRNGRVQRTVGTRVVDETVVPSGDLVAVQAPTVLYFANGSNRLTAASTRALRDLMPDARRASSLLVAGHTGNLAGESSNLVALSQRRAMQVRSLMRGQGARQTIAIWSFGASDPVTNSRSAKQQAKNRRAEVYLVP